MKLGLGSYIFRYQIGTDTFRPSYPMGPLDVIESAVNLGVRVVQFADNLPLHTYDSTTFDKMQRRAAETGMTIEVGTAGANVERLLQYLEIAKQLHSPLLRLSLHGSGENPSYEESVASIREVLPEYKKANVAIAIENHFTMLTSDLIRLVKGFSDPYLGLCLDTGNSIIQNEWPFETVEQLAPYAISLHLKDYQLAPDPTGVGGRIFGAPLGTGNLDIQSVLRMVRENAPDLNVILEQWLPEQPTQEQTINLEQTWIKENIRFARRFIAD